MLCVNPKSSKLKKLIKYDKLDLSLFQFVVVVVINKGKILQ